MISGFPSDMHFFISKVTPRLSIFALYWNWLIEIADFYAFLEAAGKMDLSSISNELSCRILLRLSLSARTEIKEESPLQGGPLTRINRGTRLAKNLNTWWYFLKVSSPNPFSRSREKRCVSRSAWVSSCTALSANLFFKLSANLAAYLCGIWILVRKRLSRSLEKR